MAIGEHSSMTKPSSPLADIRVLELGSGLASAYASGMLADLGAHVVKVEPPAGDPYRANPPIIDGLSTLFTAANRNKHLLGLEREAPGAAAVVDRLVGQADVVVEDVGNHEARAVPLGARHCHEVNPGLVHCLVTGFYPNEPSRPGENLLVQAESGILSLFQGPDRESFDLEAAGYPNLAQVTGLWVTQAALAALLGPRRSATVSVSMIDTALWLLSENVSGYLASGQPAHQSVWGVYATKSNPIAVTLDSDEVFARFAGIVGPPVQGDARFTTVEQRRAHRAELDRAIQQALGRRGAERWYRDLEAAAVPAAVIRELPEALQRFASWSSTGLRCLHEQGPTVVAPPAVFSNDRWPMPVSPRPVGRDTAGVLTDAGFTPGEIAELQDAGIVVVTRETEPQPVGGRPAH